jgi:hypothetical protein
MGYRLVSREARSLGPEVASDILDCLADAHTRLSEGQGAELLWRDALDKRLTPLDALKIYALKTSPAFEAALVRASDWPAERPSTSSRSSSSPATWAWLFRSSTT